MAVLRIRTRYTFCATGRTHTEHFGRYRGILWVVPRYTLGGTERAHGVVRLAGGLKGLPPGWENLLKQANISREEAEDNLEELLDVLRFHVQAGASADERG